jgi:prepilin-type N-terminal cleavage/methylation domain-containing protein
MEMKHAKKQQGFTLVELIVAMSLFSIIVVVISGIFMQTVKFQKIVANRASAIDNLGLAMEEMVRGIRTGVYFPQLLDSENLLPQNSITFTDYRDKDVTYALEGDHITKYIEGNYNEPLAITSSNVEITNLKFILKGKNKTDGSRRDDNIPPRITISMTAEGIYKELFTIQTTVGARLIYYKAR